MIVIVLAVFVSAAVFAGGEKRKPEKPVNINTATVEELAQLPGVGKTIARRIVRHREKSGPFRRVDELLVIRGISAKKLEALRPYVTVGEEKPPSPTGRPS
ncbi:MAG: ComEA family DNA-binding protein [Candidatus Acidiferrales bacterium]